ncbi:MAG: hypothetical protein ACHQT8_05300 [Chlamydiales bacterium]
MSIINLSAPLQQKICSYLGASEQLRVANTCKPAQRFVAQMQMRTALQSAYQEGLVGGTDLYFSALRACCAVSMACLACQVSGEEVLLDRLGRQVESLSSERLDVSLQKISLNKEKITRLDGVKNEVDGSYASKISMAISRLSLGNPFGQINFDWVIGNRNNAYQDAVGRLEMQYEPAYQRLDARHAELGDAISIARTNRDRENIAADWRAAYAPLGTLGVMIGGLSLVGMHEVDHALRDVEMPMFNRYFSVVGALSLGWGMVCLSYEHPVQGVPLAMNGVLLLTRGLTSYRFVTRVCGEVRGRWNVVYLRTSIFTKSRLFAARYVVTRKLGQAAGVIAASVSRVFQRLPFPDCG